MCYGNLNFTVLYIWIAYTVIPSNQFDGTKDFSVKQLLNSKENEDVIIIIFVSLLSVLFNQKCLWQPAKLDFKFQVEMWLSAQQTMHIIT